MGELRTVFRFWEAVLALSFIAPTEAGSHLMKPTRNRAERISGLEPPTHSDLFRFTS